jgi:hypothetical protein
MAVILLFFIAAGFCLAALVYKTPAINAQGTRKFTPDGFEFSTTTPVLKYHFPREKYKATTFKGTWIAENAEEIRPNFVIDTAEAKLGAQPVVFFNLSKPKGDWPKGLYRLEIRADEALVHTERFVIQ